MPKRNDKFARNERQGRAWESKEAREARSDEDQLVLVISRSGNVDSKEVRRLSKSIN